MARMAVTMSSTSGQVAYMSSYMEDVASIISCLKASEGS